MKHIKLNRVQKEFMLDYWFKPQDLLMYFKTADVGRIADRDIELKPDPCGWPTVIVDGEEKALIDAARHHGKYVELIGLSDE